MRTYSKIATAVAVALSSSAALADPTWSVELTMAGSSAMRDAVTNELKNVLCQGDFVSYTSTQGNPAGESPDFKAVTCTLNTNSGLSGTGVVVYYRSEGGSIFGVFGNSSLHSPSLQINRLNIGTSGALNAAPYSVYETVAQLQGDSQTGAVTKDTVDLGISDVEPTAFIGENYGSEYSFVTYAQPTSTQLKAVPKAVMVGQVFAPIVSNSGGSSVFASATGFSTHSLTNTELAAIFSGALSDWSLIPSAKDLGTAGGPITVCRRDAGSGTQTITSTHFLNATCANAGLPFDTKANAIVNYATADVLTCMKTAGAIGIVTLQPPAKYTGVSATQVQVNGVQGSSIAAAQGLYTYYGEVYSVPNSSLSGNASALAAKIVGDLQLATAVPPMSTVPNLVALPKYNAVVYPASSFVAPQQIPIGYATTAGNTCTPMSNSF